MSESMSDFKPRATSTPNASPRTRGPVSDGADTVTQDSMEQPTVLLPLPPSPMTIRDGTASLSAATLEMVPVFLQLSDLSLENTLDLSEDSDLVLCYPPADNDDYDNLIASTSLSNSGATPHPREATASKRRCSSSWSSTNESPSLKRRKICSKPIATTKNDAETIPTVGDGSDDGNSFLDTTVSFSIDDSFYWMVKCDVKKERASVWKLLIKFLSMSEREKASFAVKSFFARDCIEGYIYVEAHRREQVKGAISGIPELRSGIRNPLRIPIREMHNCLRCVELNEADE